MDKNMKSSQPSIIKILDKFDDYNYSLTFIESALRAMISTGNINEAGVNEGLTVILSALIKDYQQLQTEFQHKMLEKAESN